MSIDIEDFEEHTSAELEEPSNAERVLRYLYENDTNNLVVDFIEVSLPFIVGVSLIIGGTWLARTHPTDRIIQLAMWILGGALVGVAVTVWVLFIISLEQVPAGEPTVLVLNDVGLFMAAGILLGYYATGFEAREHELELSEQRFRALTENSSFAVITLLHMAVDAGWARFLFEYLGWRL
ncbi:hypothetical protein [Halostagnicola sp. A56]|uniref:hypothetical protein n=1 Tax=Halostagnicola sp. A56 TaxID=1495067 RepID=UPI0012E1C5EB|nr:hypothetical protein [Halostagnicola sp. A56]